jgi:hypothetical protein
MKGFNYKVLPYLLMGAVLLSVFLWSEHDERSLNEHSRYSVGVTTEYYTTAAGDKKISFEFVLNNERVLGGHTDYTAFELNKRYFVRFDSANARNSELLRSPAVPDTLVAVPPGGWLRLPVPH